MLYIYFDSLKLYALNFLTKCFQVKNPIEWYILQPLPDAWHNFRLLQIRSCWMLICFACWTQFATFCFQQPFYFLFDCASKFSNRLSFYLISIARPRQFQMGRKMFQNVVWNCYLIRIAPSSISNYLGTIYIYASPTTNKTTNQGYRKKEYLLVALSLRRRKM